MGAKDKPLKGGKTKANTPMTKVQVGRWVDEVEVRKYSRAIEF